MLPVNLFELDYKIDSDLTRVILVCRYKDKWLLCKHKEKGTWEVPGGHIEAGEDWLAAAKRELLEETGVIKANIERICFYKISSYGLICFADVIELGSNKLKYEMDEVALFDELPLNMTYYDTHKKFIDKVCDVKDFVLKMNKKDLKELIDNLKISKDEYWVISSGTLVLRDLFPSAGDLDLAVTEKGFQELKENYDLYKTEKGTYQITKNIECLIDIKEDWKYENVDGINLERLAKYFDYLKNSKREKDKVKYEIVKKELSK